MLPDGIILMFAGMGMTFLFLSLLVLVVNGISFTVRRLEASKKSSQP